MPFVNPLSRKRARSHSRGPGPVHKLPRLEKLRYDGNSSRKSMESSSTGRPNVKSKVKRGMSSIMTWIRMGSKQEDEEQGSGYLDQSSLTVTRSGLRAGFSHANDSNATTVVNPLRLRLTGAETPDLVSQYSGPVSRGSFSPSSCPASPASDKAVNEDILRAPSSSSARQLRLSQSNPGLHLRLSQRLNQAFASPGTTKRSELKSRPSLQALHSAQNGTNGVTFSSSPSTYASGSTSSPQDVQQSTPATSDGATISPASVVHYDGRSVTENDRAVHFAQDTNTQSRLTPIPEGAVLPGLSILTVEATATAKIFLETYFNACSQSSSARESRRYDLERRLHELGMSPSAHNRATKGWLESETDNLRLSRVLKTLEIGRKSGKSVALGNFEVIKVLGKGSFGVVRLVKEKPRVRTAARIASAAERLRQASQSFIRSPEREAIHSSSVRRCDLNNVKSDVYAMKVIRKSDMLRNSQEGHLRAERDFLVAAHDSKWVIALREAFQDTKFLYLVMDFCIGGDFLGLLIRKNVLSEDVTKWYIAEMILCVEEAHRMKWIHRDVKPDNFLIDHRGHLKISDFGLAFDGEWEHDQRFYHSQRHDLLQKLGIEIQGDEQDIQEQEDLKNSRRIAQAVHMAGKSPRPEPPKGEVPGTEPILDWRNYAQRRRLARSVVGTSQYMAPEVIRGDLYDGRCDWWSVGIIMYECLFGYTPFACEDRHNTKLKILKHKHTLKFPECQPTRQPSRAAMNFMQSLLVEKEKRLCSRKYELNDFTKRLVGGQSMRLTADKSSTCYSGHFVYPDDAEDLKRHPYFRNIRWESMLERRPPFVPRVRGWADTKYFDEEQPISDNDSRSSCEDDPVDDADNVSNGEAPSPAKPGSKASHHHHEDQHIVPSTALKLNANTQAAAMATVTGPPIQLDQGCAADGVEIIDDGNAKPASKKKRKEKKRPRDKILRDPESGKTALKMREKGAFLGYAYAKPRAVEVIIAEAKKEESDGYEGAVLIGSSPPLGVWTQSLPREEIC